MDINGWEIIETYLYRRHRTQQDIAAALELSSAAVTQFKQGAIRLKPRQMEKIIEMLDFSPQDIAGYYNCICNARLGIVVKRHFQLSISEQAERCYLPVVGEDELAGFIPALETIDDFVRRTAGRRYCDGSPRGASFVIGDRRHLVFVDGSRVPGEGELAAALKSSGVIVVGYLRTRGGSVLFDSGEFGGASPRWNCAEHPCEYRFVRAVKKVKFTLCRNAFRPGETQAVS